MLRAFVGAAAVAGSFALCGLVACAEGGGASSAESRSGAAEITGDHEKAPAPKPATPPFAVEGELEGLLLVWFDGEGTHAAKTRSDIPEAHRAQVRVDSPRVPPDKRLPPDEVYVADLRAPNDKGTFAVQIYPRATYDALVDQAIAAVAPKAEEVVLYKASWCGVCKQAAAFFEQQQVPFVERDVEKDPGANAEMQRKAQAAGKSPRGVPVIDFHGQIVLGFDRQALTSLIAKQKANAI